MKALNIHINLLKKIFNKAFRRVFLLKYIYKYVIYMRNISCDIFVQNIHNKKFILYKVYAMFYSLYTF